MTRFDTPWLSEPDAVDLTDDATGFPIALRRGPVGAWCGYIGIPADHPLHGKSYSHRLEEPAGWREREATVDQIGVMNLFCFALGEKDGTVPLDMIVRCHGGLTYAGKGWWEPEDRASHWFGFDCAHAGDLCPKSPHVGDVYRDVEFVIAAARQAAADLMALAPNQSGDRFIQAARDIARGA